jgi:hypothetical protein
MDSNIDKMEQYLQGVHVPQHVSDVHRQRLRQRILKQVEERHIASGHRRWAVPAALAALLCIACSAAALVIVRHGITSRTPVIAQESSGQGYGPTRMPNIGDANMVVVVEQAAGSLQDINDVHPNDGTELVQVIESEVNGRLAGRMLVQKCMSSNRQTRPVSEGDLDGKGQNLLVTLPTATRTEMSLLRQAGKGENLGTQERQIKGRTFLFKRERYTLHDGTRVTLSVGEPNHMRQAFPPAPAGNNR